MATMAGDGSGHGGGQRRVVGVAMDYSASSRRALEWAIQNLLRGGDDLVVIHVLPLVDEWESKHPFWHKTGSPLLPLIHIQTPELMRSYGLRFDAEVIDTLDTAERQMKVNVAAKMYWGDAKKKLCEAVEDINLDMLVMGSRGLGPLKRILRGSVSRYVASNILCPVTIVKGK